MSVWGEVFGSLQRMSAVQLLCAFVACIGYALAQGGLVGSRFKLAAVGGAGVAVLGFVLETDAWVHGIVLVVCAVAGLGLFAGAVWLVSGLLGVNAVSASWRGTDSALGFGPEPDATTPMAPIGRPLGAHTQTAPSH